MPEEKEYSTKEKVAIGFGVYSMVLGGAVTIGGLATLSPAAVGGGLTVCKGGFSIIKAVTDDKHSGSEKPNN